MPTHKCLICNKKLRTIMLPMHHCRCDHHFCSEHLHAHQCTYIYKPVQLETTKGVKVDKI